MQKNIYILYTQKYIYKLHLMQKNIYILYSQKYAKNGMKALVLNLSTKFFAQLSMIEV